MRILLVEDDTDIASILTDVLTEQRYAVDVATDGQEGWDLAESVSYDLILLDVGLPKMDGLSLCRKLRAKNYHMPILLLTAKSNSTDMVTGLDAGADDYVVKPFKIPELSARIRALLRRGEVPASPILKWGDLSLDPTTCQVNYVEQPLHLSPKEYALLELFLRNSRRVFSRSAILDHLWSFDDSPGEDTVKAHIKGLRQKLRAVGAADLIETVYGLGYRLRSLESNKPETLLEKPTGPAEGTAADPAKQAQAKAAVAQAWMIFKPGMLNRVALLERAIEQLKQGQLTEDLQFQAAREAHKLAGSAGMYGFHQATQLARQLEQILQANQLQLSQAAELMQLVKELRQQFEESPGQGQSAELLSWVKPGQSQEGSLLVITGDQKLQIDLTTGITAVGLRVTTASNLMAARQIIESERPDLVLLDLANAKGKPAELSLLSDLSACAPPIPVITLTAAQPSVDRLTIARLGGRPLLQQPVAADTILDLLQRVLRQIRSTAIRILLVDDDLLILTTLRHLLEPWGFQVTTLADPLQFDRVLEESNPELVVLDVDMPQRNGIELCEVIRNHSRLNWLPVLFLTGRNDTDTIQRVFAAGADDFISKPIAGPELLTRIHNRLERTRLIRSLAQTDPLTGAANQQKSMEEFQRYIEWAEQYQHPWVLAVLDLDSFKQVNHLYTHAVGDRVLQWLGKQLKQTFKGDQIVARWGGAAFLVGMYGITAEEGSEWLSTLLDSLKQQAFTGLDSTSFQVTFSAGVAAYPQHGSDVQALYRSATAALEQAKAAGRSRIVVSRTVTKEQL